MTIIIEGESHSGFSLRRGGWECSSSEKKTITRRNFYNPSFQHSSKLHFGLKGEYQYQPGNISTHTHKFLHISARLCDIHIYKAIPRNLKIWRIVPSSAVRHFLFEFYVRFCFFRVKWSTEEENIRKVSIVLIHFC